MSGAAAAVRVAVVTGGARGIGRAVAAELVARGYTVVLGDLDLELTRTTAAALGPDVVARRLDVRDTTMLARLVDEVEDEIGPIEVWVNNAGVMPTGRFTDQDAAAADLVVDVDYRAVVHATRLVLPRMLARGRGAVVQVASATGSKPMAGLAVYSGAKAAVIGFSEALRRELRGTGVQVSVVLPYLAATAMGAGIPPQRGFRAVTAEQVGREVVRAIEHRRFAVYVPRRLGVLAWVFGSLPLRVRDVVDDVIASDRIGLGTAR